MKIFYGIQGTGNGHITRGRAMAAELAKAGHQVSYLFSGREWGKLFEMEPFQSFEWRKGLTFHAEGGRINYLKTALECRPLRFLQDIRQLDLRDYDLVISDYEPVTAWAAKSRGIPVIGIGHQYAFHYDIPKTGFDFISRQTMQYFAPANIGVGLHWHHFGQPILPPIVEPAEQTIAVRKDKIIVYLPFENPVDTIALLKPFKSFHFHVYTAVPVSSGAAHIQIYPLSRHAFQQDFQDAAGIISNAGFELISEALQAGKKILVKPLHQQPEQSSNALALTELQYGQATYWLQRTAVEGWLHESYALRIAYPNVAAALVERLADGPAALLDPTWNEQIWRQVEKTSVAL
jgi:uncharacterized protein (TIGR00661 family)